MKQTFFMAHELARSNAIEAVRNAPEGYKVTIDSPRRTDPENRLLHALIGEVAVAKVWEGKRLPMEVWKRLLVAAWCRASGEPAEMYRSLDGQGIDIVPKRTGKLTKKECADLIEFIYAWGAENGVNWSVDI